MLAGRVPRAPEHGNGSGRAPASRPARACSSAASSWSWDRIPAVPSPPGPPSRRDCPPPDTSATSRTRHPQRPGRLHGRPYLGRHDRHAHTAHRGPAPGPLPRPGGPSHLWPHHRRDVAYPPDPFTHSGTGGAQRGQDPLAARGQLSDQARDRRVGGHRPEHGRLSPQQGHVGWAVPAQREGKRHIELVATYADGPLAASRPSHAMSTAEAPPGTSPPTRTPPTRTPPPWPPSWSASARRRASARSARFRPASRW
ncbi:hypothetical protein QF030_001163 [Streptomyces rishiriensis]|uniref:Uncharacterized protein n=1 Tax=Streptomyces rishiriensis TaxID=68264 RepID=A0ABU0NIT3_STRRH|nr:hypothetical protein [Streptomyces rishiriensis]